MILRNLSVNNHKMRLLHSNTLKLHEFIGSQTPPYAILSHTWGEEEVSFQELQAGKPSEKKGFEKIKRCSEIAAEDGFDWVWVDTCCIDKTSSAELSEAINSMYRWYQLAEVCYALLSDVPSDEDPYAEGSAFRKSRWFTRGWTLQELIAPPHLQFLGGDWKDIGSKLSMQDVISEITRIQTDALVGIRKLPDFSVAQRMSWASNRVTTREEDIAYCLMGIFDINMPMLYGEGTKAFIRLQEQIITNSDDDSIFAWWDQWDQWRLRTKTDGQGLLALSPKNFIRSGNIVRVNGHGLASKVSLSGGRIRWEAPVLSPKGHRDLIKYNHLVSLGCRPSNSATQSVLAIRLRLEGFGKPYNPLEFYMTRIDSDDIHTISPSDISLEMKTMSVEKISGYTRRRRRIPNTTQAFYFRCRGLPQRHIVSLEAYPLGDFYENPLTRLLPLPQVYPKLGIRLKDTNGTVLDLILSPNLHLGMFLTAFIVEPRLNESLKDVLSSFVRNDEKLNLDDWDWTGEGPPRVWPVTSDRVLWRHASGSQTTVAIKKISRQREPTLPASDKELTMKRTFMKDLGGAVREKMEGDAEANNVDYRYLIDIKLE